jgi:hypothetical protein
VRCRVRAYGPPHEVDRDRDRRRSHGVYVVARPRRRLVHGGPAPVHQHRRSLALRRRAVRVRPDLPQRVRRSARLRPVLARHRRVPRHDLARVHAGRLELRRQRLQRAGHGLRSELGAMRGAVHADRARPRIPRLRILPDGARQRGLERLRVRARDRELQPGVGDRDARGRRHLADDVRHRGRQRLGAEPAVAAGSQAVQRIGLGGLRDADAVRIISPPTGRSRSISSTRSTTPTRT